MTSRDRCPLCRETVFTRDSIPEANLYSEQLADLLGREEQQLLRDHANYRCSTCGLIFKKRWFADAVLRELFTRRVPAHPRGWDAVLDRFSPEGFHSALDRWRRGLERSETAEIRRGRRELISILDSIVEPVGFDRAGVVTAVTDDDVQAVVAVSEAIITAMGEPAPFTRFSGFRSVAMWEFFQERTGGFETYAEVGCPLWGMLPLAAQRGVRAVHLLTGEPNYWGAACSNAGSTCRAWLLRDPQITAAQWESTDRYDLVGVFQYLDHLSDPREFLERLFARAESAAVILDGGDLPLAIQHATGWNERSARYAAGLFGKTVQVDFPDIRPSGNVLFLFTGGK